MKHSFTVTIEADSQAEAQIQALHALEHHMDASKASLVELNVIQDEIKKDASVRGFSQKKFNDRYGYECSIQESSLATEAAIWFGINNIHPQICIMGEGWKKIKMPEDALTSARMHLTIPMVKELLPLLQGFVTTGDLRNPVTEYVRNENKEIANCLKTIKHYVDNEDSGGWSMEDIRTLFEQENLQNFLKDDDK